MISLSFVSKIKSRDAILIFCWLWERVGRRPSAIEGATYEKLAAELNASGQTTSRGGLFTRPVVTARLGELKAAGVVSTVSAGVSGAFDLLVYNPAPNPTPLFPTNGEPSTPLFRFQNENDNGIENENETPETAAPVAITQGVEIPTFPTFGDEGETENVAEEAANAPPKEINININKKINKPAKDFFENSESETIGGVGPRIERPTEATKPGLRGSADGSRAVAAFDDVRRLLDFDAPNVATLRRAVVRDIWEPELRSELVDRIVFGLVRGIVGRAEWRGIVAEAQNRRDVYRRSKDGKGAATLWQTVAVKVKSAFDAAGWTWTPTANRREPEPTERVERRAVAVDDDAESPAESLAALRAVARGFEAADAELPLKALTRKVCQVRGVYGIAAQTTAIAIRNALNRIAETTRT